MYTSAKVDGAAIGGLFRRVVCDSLIGAPRVSVKETPNCLCRLISVILGGFEMRIQNRCALLTPLRKPAPQEMARVQVLVMEAPRD